MIIVLNLLSTFNFDTYNESVIDGLLFKISLINFRREIKLFVSFFCGQGKLRKEVQLLTIINSPVSFSLTILMIREDLRDNFRDKDNFYNICCHLTIDHSSLSNKYNWNLASKRNDRLTSNYNMI